MVDPILYLSAVGTLLSYLAWQRVSFASVGEIEMRIQSRFDNNYSHIDESYQYEIAEVIVSEPKFPKNWYKYIPLAKREGWTQIRIVFTPLPGEEGFELPDKKAILNHDLIHDDIIRVFKLDQYPEQGYAEITLQIDSVHHRDIHDTVKLTLLTIYEIRTGKKNNELRDHLKFDLE